MTIIYGIRRYSYPRSFCQIFKYLHEMKSLINGFMNICNILVN